MPANAPMPGETWYPRSSWRNGVKVQRGTTVEWVLYRMRDDQLQLTMGAKTEDFVRWYEYAGVRDTEAEA